MGTKRVNNAQKAKDVKDIAKHILYSPWFTGNTTRGHWSLIVCIICTSEHTIVLTEQRFKAYCEDGTTDRAGVWDETLFSCFTNCSIQGNHTEKNLKL
jgi:hypothetical protein